MAIELNQELSEAEVSCDFCAYSETFDGEYFREITNDMKADGWKIAFDKENESWTHKCPDCIDKEKEKSFNKTKIKI